MSNEKIMPWKKIEKLEMSVMQDAPNDVAKALEQMGKVEFTARALGLACRFRGLEMVKTLVEHGVSFSFEAEKLRPIFRRSQLVYLDQLYGDENYSLSLISTATRRETAEIINLGKHFCGVQLVPLNERLRILNYLCQNADKISFDPDEFLFYAHFSEEREMIELLKNKGAAVPENRIKMITEGGNNDDWLTYCWMVCQLNNEQFFKVMNALIAECNGKKLHFTELFWDYNEKRLGTHGFFKFLLENFNQSKMNKTKLLKKIIDCGNVECLAFCAENGWLKMPKKRDEIINYATENKKTECTAYLLDFKNRTADLAAERAKADKRAERELNASPTSVTMMRKIWGFKKQNDDTLMITNYKGNSTEVTVPDKIGKSPVTTIGNGAFSGSRGKCGGIVGNPYSTFEHQKAHREITKITLPKSVRAIDKGAFGDMPELTEINIPEAVTEIGDAAFYECIALAQIILPRSIKHIGEHAFRRCDNLTAVVTKDSYAENYCKKHNVRCVCKENL